MQGMRRGYLADHHMPAFEGVSVDVNEFAQWEAFIDRACVDHVMVYCKDHWGYSWYNTRIGTPHPLLNGFDWVEHAVSALRERNIAFTAYYCIEYDSLAVRAHPEWSTIDATGVPLVCGMPGNTTHAAWGMPCPETEYRSQVLAQLKEICDRFSPDLLFLDIFGKSLCFCPKCRRGFRDRYGFDLPTDAVGQVKHHREIGEYLEESSVRLLRDVRDTIGNVPLTINFACHYSKRIRDQLDHLYTEPWAGNRLSAIYARGLAEGKPVFLGPGDISKVFEPRNVNAYRVAADEISSVLGRVFMYSESMRPNGLPVMQEAERVRAAYSELIPIESILGRGEPIADIAIVQSDAADMLRTDEVFPPRSVARVLRSGPQRKAVRQWMEICDRSGLTWCVLPDTQITPSALRNHKMLILNNVFNIADETAEAIRDYVQDGGTVFLVGENGVLNEVGDRIEVSGFEQIAGCRAKGVDVRFEKNAWTGFLCKANVNEMPDTEEIAIAGKRLMIETISATVEYLLEDPAVELAKDRWINWGMPGPKADAVRPGILKNVFGNGCVYTFAFDLAEIDVNEFPALAEMLITRMKAAIDPSIEMTTSAKGLIVYSAFREKDTVTIHLINRIPTLTNGGIVPVADVRIRSDRREYEVLSAELVYPDRHQPDILPERTDGTIIALPPIELYSIIRLRIRQ